MDNIELIKSRLAIEELVSRYVQLKKVGRNFRGLCPFHQEKTPSFYVSTEKQLAYCFGCHKGGDIFKFVQEMEGLDFRGALKFLADQTGVEITFSHKSQAEIAKEKDSKERLYQINQAASDFWQDYLWNNPAGKAGLDYFYERGLTESTIRDFSLGLAPDSFEVTYQHLLYHGFSHQELVTSGLAVAKDIEQERLYDRFRGRLMFPIADLNGRMVGFSGRILQDTSEAKYVNSPETVLYNKSNLLYGLDLAKSAIRSESNVILVEGNMDAIACHQAGIKQAVAVCGTALTTAQLQLLQRFTKRLYFCFDADKAGQAALRRAIELGQKIEVEMGVITMPFGKDPDEAIRHDQAAFREAILSPTPYLEFYLKQTIDQLEGSLEQRKQATHDFLLLLKGLRNTIERDLYVKKMASALQMKSEYIYDELAHIKTFSISSPRETSLITEKKQAWTPVGEEYFLGLLVNFPQFISEVRNILPSDFFKPELKTVYEKLLTIFDQTGNSTVSQLTVDLPTDLLGLIERLSLWVEIHTGDLSPDDLRAELLHTLDTVRENYYANQRRQLIFSMKQARTAGNLFQEQRLFKEYSDLIEDKASNGKF